MQLGLTTGRVSGAQAIVGVTAMAFLLFWTGYLVWIRNADLRPPTQLAAAADITTCIEHYADQRDDKLSRMDILWWTYALCEKITSQKLLDEEQVIRNENFVFQRYENTIIMLMVVSITISGVILAGLQLLASYRLASLGKDVLSETSEVNLSFNRMAVRSSVVGVIILAISFAFFLVFVLYVYTFTPDHGDTQNYLAPRSVAQPGGAKPPQGDVKPPPNIGQAMPSPPPPAATPQMP